ncbi:putative ribonuclease H-like domain-containing protein [Tanacetum coccineum]
MCRAYTYKAGEETEGGSKPLCLKCNYHHDGQCAPKCTNCKRIGHLAQDCKSQPAATNNNQRAQGANQRVLTCFEWVGSSRVISEVICPKLKQEIREAQAGEGGCSFEFLTHHSTSTDLMPVNLGSLTYNGMDWLSMYHARDTIAQTRPENVSKLSNDPLLARGNTLRSGEDSLKLQELMALCTTLQQRVLDLETTKTTQATEIVRLKRRVKKLKRRNKSKTHGLKRLYRVGSSRRVESFKDEGLGEEDASKQGRIAYIDANKDIYLVNVQTDEATFDVNDLDSDEVIVESVDVVNTAKETRSVVEEVTAVTIPVSAATTTTTTNAITDVEITLAQALAELKSAKPKADKVVIQEPDQGTTTPTLTTTTNATTITAVSTRPRAKGLVIHEQEQAPTPTVSLQQPSYVKVQDKGKGKMVEPEPVKKMSKKELLRLDEELAFKLQAEEEEE